MEPLIFKEKIAFHRKWPDENLRAAGFEQAKKGGSRSAIPFEKKWRCRVSNHRTP